MATTKKTANVKATATKATKSAKAKANKTTKKATASAKKNTKSVKATAKKTTKKAEAAVNEAKVDIVETVEEMSETVETAFARVSEIAHKTFQASLGAMVIAQEELSARLETARNRAETISNDTGDFTSKLIERGEGVRGEGMTRLEEGREELVTRINDLIAPQREQVTSLWNQAETRFDSTLERTVGILNIPTKDSIEGLNKKIGSLTRKVDQIRKEQAA